MLLFTIIYLDGSSGSWDSILQDQFEGSFDARKARLICFERWGNWPSHVTQPCLALQCWFSRRGYWREMILGNLRRIKNYTITSFQTWLYWSSQRWDVCEARVVKNGGGGMTEHEHDNKITVQSKNAVQGCYQAQDHKQLQPRRTPWQSTK